MIAQSRGRRALWVVAVLVPVALLAAAAALGVGPASRPKVLTAKAATAALESLPYEYDLRPVDRLPRGARAAIAGEAVGPAHTRLQFGVALGRESRPVPVPDTGVTNVTFVPAAGFAFTDDTLEEFAPHKFRLGPNIHTRRQFRVVAEMVTRMESALCMAATGKNCGI